MNLMYRDDIDRFADQDAGIDNLEKSLTRIRWRLKAFGLSVLEVKIVIARCWENRTFKDIKDVYSLTSTGSAEYHYKRAIAKLRAKGFNANDLK